MAAAVEKVRSTGAAGAGEQGRLRDLVEAAARQTLEAQGRCACPQAHEDREALIETVVRRTLEEEGRWACRLPDDGRLAFSEPEAAAMLSMNPWQLRDERLRGRITASKIAGRKIRYTKQDLLDYLAAARVNEA